MSQKGLVISTFAVAVSVIACITSFIYDESSITALGMLLCTLVIYFSSLSLYKKDND